MGNTRNRYPGRRRFLKQSAALSAGAASLATPAIVLGQGSQATTAKPVRILVGAPPGGTTDTVARGVMADMAKALGQQVIVENRSGAGGNVAAEAVARSAPDGTTLLVSFTSHTINATLYPKLPFDPVKDFTPITMLTTSPSLLIGHPGGACELARRARGAAAKESRQVQLRHRRPGLVAAHGRREIQARYRYLCRQHPLPRQRAGAAGPDRRARFS